VHIKKGIPQVLFLWLCLTILFINASCASVDELLEEVKAEGMNFQLLRFSTLTVPSYYPFHLLTPYAELLTTSNSAIALSLYHYFDLVYNLGAELVLATSI